MTDESPLHSRALRDHFTHYDERLDAWAADQVRSAFADGNIGPVANLPVAEDRVFRHYDPKTDRLIFLGTTHALGPIADELRRICSYPVGYATRVRSP